MHVFFFFFFFLKICRTGSIEFFERFLGFGADIHVKNNKGDTLVHTAVEFSQV